MPPKQPNFDYFYGIEADQFTFYRIPKELFTNSYFNDLSTEAKLLYGLMLDRMSLSRKNEWFDSENRVFVIFTQEDARDLLKCSKNKVVTFFAELDKYGLITRKKQGQGKPTIIYIMNIYSITADYDSNEYANEDISKDENLSEETNEELPSECAASPDVKNDFGESMSEDCQIQTSQNRKSRVPESEIGSQEFPKQEVLTSQNRKPRVPKTGSLEFPKQDANNTNISYINISNTDNNYTDSSSWDKRLRDISAFYKSITNLDLDKQKQKKVKYWLSKIPANLILRALDKANDRNVLHENIFRYVDSIINNYIKNGICTLEQVEKAERDYKTNNLKTVQNVQEKPKQPRGTFNNYNQIIYTAEDIAEIERKNIERSSPISDAEFEELKLKMKSLNNMTS